MDELETYTGGVEYCNSGGIFVDAKGIVDSTRRAVHGAANVFLVLRNWLLGRRIAEEELRGADRAEYGAEVIKQLSRDLTEEYGKGFGRRSLHRCLQFYREYPEIVSTALTQFGGLLSWSHYLCLLGVSDPDARAWYEADALREAWSFKTLQRNIYSQYYYRLLKSQVKQPVVDEMRELTADYQTDRLEFVKNPVMVDFLGFSDADVASLRESALESALIDNLRKFLLELGKGYAFVARLQHIRTEKEDYCIDLVFYNYILKCFVLIDLKTTKITHQDVGQMDMYVRRYDELRRGKDNNPTLGIVLCSETDEDVARYSVMHDSDQLFMSKYLTCLPSKEQLRAEIETQKAMYLLQHGDED